MENLKRIENQTHSALGEEEPRATTILPINRKGRARPLRALFFLFLLAFFGYCAVLAVLRLFPEGRLSIGAFEWLLTQEFGVPK